MRVLGIISSDTSNSTYEIRTGEDYIIYCTCMAWKMNKQTPKTCKHFLRFMNAEIKFLPDGKPVSKNKTDFRIRAVLLED